MTRDIVTIGGFLAICGALLHFGWWVSLLFGGMVFFVAGLFGRWHPPDQRKPG